MAPAYALIGTALNTTSLLAPRVAGRAAFELFKHPVRRGRVRTTERELHERAATEELTVNGKRVVVYRWGDGRRPVLMVHGWQSRASRFTPYVPRLRALGFTPIAFDTPGHGESGGRATTILEVRDVIRRLHERYGDFESVIAHSFGVTCAVLALRGGVRAGRLAAVSGVVEFDYLPSEFCRQLGLNARIGRELRRRIEEVLFAGAREAEGVASIWGHFDAAHRPEDLRLPILAVHDEDDGMVGLDQSHRLKAAYGDRLDLIVTRGLGHRRILAEPTVVDNVIGFLTEEPPAVEAADAATHRAVAA